MARANSVAFTRFTFGSTYRLALTALLLTLLTMGPVQRAQAGDYQLVNTSGSGSITRTPVVGEPWTSPLTTPEFDEWVNGFDLSYQYSETYQYQWVPEPGYTYEDDPPIPTVLTLEALLTIRLRSTPAGMDDSGSGSAVLNADGSKITGNGSWDLATQVWADDGNGTALVFKDIEVSGDAPVVTVTFTGSADVDEFGVVGVDLALRRCPPRRTQPRRRFQESILIVSPANEARFGLTADVPVSYIWSAASAPDGTVYHVELWSWHTAEGWRKLNETLPNPVKNGSGVLLFPGVRDHFGWFTLEVRLIRLDAGPVTAARDSRWVYIRNY